MTLLEDEAIGEADGSGAAPASPARFADFFQEAYPILVASARSLVPDGGMAEDIAQEALCRVLRVWERVDVDGHPISYARKVVRNLAIDAYRSRRELAHDPDQLTRLVDQAPQDLSDSATDRELLEILREAVMVLPGKRREVVRLRLAGVEDHVIADLLGISRSTVAVHFHRARADLVAHEPVMRRIRQRYVPVGRLKSTDAASSTGDVEVRGE